MTAMNVIPFKLEFMEAIGNEFQWRRDLIYREISKIFSGYEIDLVAADPFSSLLAVRIKALNFKFRAPYVLEKPFLELKMLVNSLSVEELPKYVDYTDKDAAFDDSYRDSIFIRVMVAWRIKNGGALL